MSDSVRQGVAPGGRSSAEPDDDVALSQDIIKHVGGAANISAVSHCYTRLRLTLREPDLVDEAALTSRSRVLGLVRRGSEHQVVIGPAVSDLYPVVLRVGGLDAREEGADAGGDDTSGESRGAGSTTAGGGTRSGEAGTAAEGTTATWGAPPAEHGPGARGATDPPGAAGVRWAAALLDFIGGTFSPVIPVLVAGGLTGAFLTVLTSFLGVSDSSGTYQVFYAVNQAAFYFLPVFIGFSAARRLGADGYLGAFLGTVLLYSTIDGAEGLDVAGVPVATVTYNTTVFPVILGAALMSLVYRLVGRVLPAPLRAVFLPLLTMVVTVPVTLVALGPVGGLLGGWLATGVTSLYHAAPPVAVMVIGAATPFLVFLGMNNALYPVVFALMASMGGDPLVCAGMLAANTAVGGACLAAAVRSRGARTRSVALSAGVTGLLGITEPGVYGVLFPLRWPLVAAVAGGAAGGLLSGFLGVRMYAVASPSLASLPAFIAADGTFTNLYGALAVATASTVVALVVGVVAGPGRRKVPGQQE